MMSTDSNMAASRRLLDEGFNQGRIEVVDEICAPEITTNDPAETEAVSGRQAHKERIQAYRTAMPDLTVTADDVLAAGNEVVIRWTVTGTNDGEFMGMPPTGRKINITGISIDRFNDAGQITEVWDQWDNLGFMQQLGLVPEMAGQTG